MQVYDGFKGPEWKFIEYMFIKKPEQECSTTAKRIRHWGLTFLTQQFSASFMMILHGKVCNNPRWFNDFLYEVPPSYDANDEVKKSYLKKKHDHESGCIRLAFTIPFTIIIYYLYNRWYRNSTEYGMCSNFIANWPEYKEVTPQELHSSFDSLYQKYKQKKLSNHDVYEIIAVVKELVKLQ